MTAVAGDFYWFIAVDPTRAGFLVADVSGHGVPAALIASMIKVAMQSVVPCADDPGAVLRGLERALSGQLRGQYVSAAYLWLDTESRKALYSAAGHPPLLRWRKASWIASKATAYFSECKGGAMLIRFVRCRSNQATASCFTPTV